MKCPKCGTTVKDDAKFCFACGAKLEQPKALAEPEKIEVQHVKTVSYTHLTLPTICSV